MSKKTESKILRPFDNWQTHEYAPRRPDEKGRCVRCGCSEGEMMDGPCKRQAPSFKACLIIAVVLLHLVIGLSAIALFILRK